MEYVFEALADLILEFGIEISKNKKVPKIIRYLLVSLILFIFIGIIGIVFLAGLLVFLQDIIGGIIILAIDIVMLVFAIKKFKKIYLVKKKH